MVTPVKSQDTTVAVHNAASAFIEVEGVRSVGGLGAGQAAVIDATHLKSAAKEKSMGLPDEGQFTLECIYDPTQAGQARLIALYASQEKDSFKFTLTDVGNQELTCDAFVISRELSVNQDNIDMMTFTCEVDGLISFS